MRVNGGAWLAIVISAAIVFAVWHWHLLPIGNSRTQPISFPTPNQPQRSAPPSSRADNVVRLRPSASLTIPATHVSRWTVRDSRFGTIAVYVPVGETPLEALTVALAERGYQVVSP